MRLLAEMNMLEAARNRDFRRRDDMNPCRDTKIAMWRFAVGHCALSITMSDIPTRST